MPDRPVAWTDGRRVTCWLRIIAFGFPLLIAIAAVCWSRPLINPDTSTALRAWDGWVHHHGEWNRIIHPSPADLSVDTATWLGWWSPGQYFWTGCFSLLTDDLGLAAILSALVACWIKSIGLYRLLRAFAVAPSLAWWAVAAEAVSWNLYTGFAFYGGAEVFQAAYFPWFLLALVTLGQADRPTLRWLWLIPLFFAGAAIKYSLEIAAVAGGAWLVGEVGLNRDRPWRDKLAAAAYVGLALAVMGVATHRLLTQGAGDPSQIGGGSLPAGLAWSFAFAAPFLSATGFGSLVTHRFFVTGIAMNDGWQGLVPVMLAAAAPLLLLYGGVCWAQADRRFGRLLAWLLATYCGALGILLARGASISLEDRHFRLPGMVLLTGIVLAALDRRKIRANRAWAKWLMGSLAGAAALYGVGSGLLRIRTLARLDRVAACGLSLPNLDRAADRELLRLDRAGEHTRNVICVADPVVGLEVRYSRLIVSDMANQPVRFDTMRFYGRVPQLTLVLPAAWSGSAELARAEGVFPGYSPSAWHSWVVGTCCFAQAQIKPAAGN